jgi:hypothetical protein
MSSLIRWQTILEVRQGLKLGAQGRRIAGYGDPHAVNMQKCSLDAS